MPRDERLETAIDSFYEACAMPALLSNALDQIAQAMGARGALLSTPTFSSDRMPISPGIRESAHAFFEEGWFRHDERTIRGAQWAQCHPDRFVRDQDLFCADEQRHHTYYRGFANKHDVPFFAAGLLSGDPANFVALSFNRRAKEGAFSDDDIERLERALPRLRQATLLGTHVAFVQQSGMLQSFDLIDVAAFLLNDLGGVLRLNQRANALLGGTLSVRQGRLQASDRAAQTGVDRSIAEALTGFEYRPADDVHCACWHAGDPPQPVVLHVIPLHGAGRDVFQNAAAIALLLHGEEKGAASPDLLRKMFGLTPREAEVAVRLAQGLSLEAIAETLGLTIETARFYSKVIYRKTDTRRQAELVRKLSCLSIIRG